MSYVEELNAYELFDVLDKFCNRFHEIASREVIDGLAEPKNLGCDGLVFRIYPTTLLEMRDMVHGLLSDDGVINYECAIDEGYEELTNKHINLMIGEAVVQYASRVKDDEAN